MPRGTSRDPFSAAADSFSSSDGSLQGGFSAEFDGNEDTDSERSLLQANKAEFAYSRSLTQTSSKLRNELSLARQTEDPQRHCVATMVESNRWMFAVQTVILLNILAMAVECDNSEWNCWKPINSAFLSFFLIELFGRLYVYRLSFFTMEVDRWWNIFDFTLVTTGVVDEWLSSLFMSEEEERTVSYIKLFRILRVFRALRVVRHMPRLKMLIESFISSLQASIWIFLFFYFLIAVSALLTATLIGRSRDDWPEGQRAEIDDSFNTITMSMFTMFRFTTLDDWSQTAGVVALKAPLFPVFFALYIVMTSYFVVALLTGVIFKQVLEHHNAEEAKNWQDTMRDYLEEINEKYKTEERRQGDTFRGFTFRELWGQLQLDKILDVASDEKHLHIEMEDVQDLFQALDVSGDGMISWGEFKRGMDNMSGPVTRWQVMIINGELKRILKRIETGGRDVPLEGTPQGNRREARLTALKARLDEIESLLKQVVRAGLGTLSRLD
jgi:voltage-gated sodium channel